MSDDNAMVTLDLQQLMAKVDLLSQRLDAVLEYVESNERWTDLVMARIKKLEANNE